MFAQGKELAVKSARVVSGLEPENTNAFLIDLAECAGESMYDNAEAVRRCLAGEKPGERSPPLKNVRDTVFEMTSLIFPR